jgi:hypothetical protein
MHKRSLGIVAFSKTGRLLALLPHTCVQPTTTTSLSGRETVRANAGPPLSMVSSHQGRFTFLLLAAMLIGLASESSFAQQKSVPHSLPPIFSGTAIHSTAPSSLLPNDDPVRNWLGNDNLLSLGHHSAVNPRTLRNAPNACSSDSVVCYDYTRGQARLPIAKSVMPELPGLRKESLSIRRGRLSLNYSF